MAASSHTLLRYIHGLVDRSEPDEASDATLLGRFITVRDERAFAALVGRHGPLVLQVCRRVLGNGEDVEDAFQATFLVLARKAAALRHREALPAWLHGVAHRVALKARSARASRWRTARPLTAPPADFRPDPLAELSGRELLTIIDEELQRLAEAYRLPVILCCLEGRSLEEAARQLGWTLGSVKGRLERGRARLHQRLLRRGLTLSAALATAEVSRGTASAGEAVRLAARTARGAVVFGARSPAAAEGVSAKAAALAGAMLRGMALFKLKIAAALLLATCLLATGFAIQQAAPEVGASPFSSADSVARDDSTALGNDRPRAVRDEADVPIEVRGRVLDPAGNPFAGAKLYVGYSTRRYAPAAAPDTPFRPISYVLRATSEADGRFHFAFAQSELDARWLDERRPAVVAIADRYGPDWAEIKESDQGGELNLKLVEDLPVNGRVLDSNRQPVAGARVFVREVLSDPEAGAARFLRSDINYWYPRSWRGPFPGQAPSATTDADGRFRLTGLGRERIVTLALEGPAIPDTFLTAVVRPTDRASARFNGATFDYVAATVRSIRGVVRDKATGKPVVGVRMSALQAQATTLTDEDGRFEIRSCPKGLGYLVNAQPQLGQPYFAASTCVREKDGPGPLVVDFDLVSGIPLSGRVTDLSTHKPPKTAVVEYYPLAPNPHSFPMMHGLLAASSAVIGPDGSYRLVVLPGSGVVCVAASPRNAYAVATIDDKKLAGFLHERPHYGGPCLATALGRGDQRGNLAVDKYNVLSLINPDEKAESLTLDLALQPARTLHGTVVGPDGEPLAGVAVVGLTALPDDEMLEGSSFTVTGLNARSDRELFFHHRGKGLGKILTLRGDETGPLTVQLDPCGSIMGRMVDRDGKPVPGVALLLRHAGNSTDIVAQTDRDGRFRASLPPGPKYSLQLLSSSHRLLSDVGAIEVESGRSKDLGDLPLAERILPR